VKTDSKKTSAQTWFNGFACVEHVQHSNNFLQLINVVMKFQMQSLKACIEDGV